MGNKRDLIYEEAKRMIIEGELPPLADFPEELFKSKFSTSRMPVREAVLRLEREGFVHVYPQKGTFVADISIEVLRQVYELRLLVEPALVQRACQVWTDEKIHQLIERTEQIPKFASQAEYRDYYNTFDRDLHNEILNTTDNMFLLQTMQWAYDHNHRARLLASQRAWETFELAKEEHIKLLEAIQKRDKKLAVKLIERHLYKGASDFSSLSFFPSRL